MNTETKLLREFVQASDAQDPDFDALAWIERARLASETDTTDWRELCRRLYVELFHCDQQMTQSNAVRKRPIFKQGVTVRDVLRDAKLALECEASNAGQVGTTGHADYLDDDNGNRRFWPLPVA